MTSCLTLVYGNSLVAMQEQKRVLRKWDKFLAGAALPAGQTQERTAQV